MVTLQQSCGNVLITSESDVVTTSETDIGTTLIFGRVTTLWQRQQRRCGNIVTTLLCQLGRSSKDIYPLEIELKIENKSTQGRSFLRFYLKVCGRQFSSNIFDKRDNFLFSVVGIPYLSSNSPSKILLFISDWNTSKS